MSLSLSPPPLQIPQAFAQDKSISAFFTGLINTIYQLWTAVYGIRYKAKITTTDDTVTGLVRTTIDSGKTVMLQAYVVARRTGGSSGTDGDSAFYVLTGAYKNVSGTLTGIGSANLISGEDQAGWDVGFTSSGSDAIVTVKGAVDNNITWEGTLSTYVVGS